MINTEREWDWMDDRIQMDIEASILEDEGEGGALFSSIDRRSHADSSLRSSSTNS